MSCTSGQAAPDRSATRRSPAPAGGRSASQRSFSAAASPTRDRPACSWALTASPASQGRAARLRWNPAQGRGARRRRPGGKADRRRPTAAAPRLRRPGTSAVAITAATGTDSALLSYRPRIRGRIDRRPGRCASLARSTYARRRLCHQTTRRPRRGAGQGPRSDWSADGKRPSRRQCYRRRQIPSMGRSGICPGWTRRPSAPAAIHPTHRSTNSPSSPTTGSVTGHATWYSANPAQKAFAASSPGASANGSESCDEVPGADHKRRLEPGVGTSWCASQK